MNYYAATSCRISLSSADNDTYDVSRSLCVLVLDAFVAWRLGRRNVVCFLPTAIINFADVVVVAAAAAAAVATDAAACSRQDIKVYVLPERGTHVSALWLR